MPAPRRSVCALLCVLLVSVSCGGSATTSNPGSNAGAAGMAPGAPQAGGSGTGAMAGSGSIDSLACTQTEGGIMCDGYSPVFFHNPDTGLCEPTVWGGCGGTLNAYATREACEQACPGGGSNWGACASDADCALA